MYSLFGRVESANFRFFLAVGAHDAHARQIFLGLGGKHCERSLNFSVHRVNLASKEPHRDGNHGHRQEHVNAQRRRNPEHQDYGEDHGGHGVGGVHDTGAEDHAHGVQIVRAAGHQFARAVTHVKFRLHLHEFVQQVVAQIELNVARKADQNLPRPVGENALRGANGNQRDAKHGERMRVSSGDSREAAGPA